MKIENKKGLESLNQELKQTMNNIPETLKTEKTNLSMLVGHSIARDNVKRRIDLLELLNLNLEDAINNIDELIVLS